MVYRDGFAETVEDLDLIFSLTVSEKPWSVQDRMLCQGRPTMCLHSLTNIKTSKIMFEM